MSYPTNSDDLGFSAEHPRLPPVLTSEISRLYSAGFWLIPLGGNDGKKPIIEFRDRKRQPLTVVINRMAAGGSRTFGIRLPGLLVVDVDTDTAEARSYVERRFGNSAGRVRTGRGYHLYFRHDGPKPKPVRRENVVIDFKAGANEFVVGPQSVRPDRVIYWPEARLIAPTALPKFVDYGESPSDSQPDKIGSRFPRGVRHSTLKRRAHQVVQTVDSFDELAADLLAFRDWEIDHPEDFPDSSVLALARWYWDKREAGELWTATNGHVPIPRAAIDVLARSGEGLAMLLYGILVAAHGHKSDTFAIVPDGLRNSGRLRAGRRQIYQAIDVLLKLDLLTCREMPRGDRRFYRYALGHGAEENKGGGSNLILVSEKDTHSRPPGNERAA